MGYAALHQWVAYHKGPAKEHACAHADESCSGSLHNANISGEYRRDLDDFMVLCVSHHKRYDSGAFHG